MYAKNLFVVCCAMFAGTLLAATPLTPAYDKDVDLFAKAFASQDIEVVNEAVVQLSWAGITDRRIFDPLLVKVSAPNRLNEMALRRHFEALGMSGNPEIYAALETMAKSSELKSARKGAESALRIRNRYTRIAEEMSVGMAEATTNEELWALRHRRGLAINDHQRVRLAARDIYLHNYGPESLDIAAATLRAYVDKDVKDAGDLDAMLFLCKALGISKRRQYLDTLVFVANNANTLKLMDYAERSAQYIDEGFKADNKNFKHRKPVKHT